MLYCAFELCCVMHLACVVMCCVVHLNWVALYCAFELCWVMHFACVALCCVMYSVRDVSCARAVFWCAVHLNNVMHLKWSCAVSCIGAALCYTAH